MKILSRAVLSLLVFVSFGVFAAENTEKIDINTASVEDLVRIVHIGEVRALELISLRPFSSLDDLSRIKGIGPSRIEDIKNQELAYVASSFKSIEPIKDIAEKQTDPDPSYQETFQKEISKIDINTASLIELQKMVGIGPVMAQRIIDTRPFYSVKDLEKVVGIGPKTLEGIKKQGLAWTDPGLKPPKTDLAKSVAATINKPVEQTSKDTPVTLIALFLALFSGSIVLTIKQKIKK